MRTLTQVLTKVEEDFIAGRHLDLSPWQDASPHSGTFVLREDLTHPVSETDILSDAELDMLITTRLIDSSRQRREAELLKPVTRIEVELVDNYIGDTRWNITHGQLNRLMHSRAFQSLTQTAAAKGFGFVMQTETHLNRRQVFSLRVTLVFKSFEAFKHADLKLIHGETGRTHRWYEHP
ncbi:MAG: hypothetical protein EON60_11980 [Alphaproteobacteria bacterium]|nr:MAG: hypothetical protein EON60_11980 [Alphaproteobacteria bacterium]